MARYIAYDISKTYEIYVPDEGWVTCWYNPISQKFVSQNNIYRNFKGATDYDGPQLFYLPKSNADMYLICEVSSSNTPQTPNINRVFREEEDTSTEDQDYIKIALLENPLAVSFSILLQRILPLMYSMGGMASVMSMVQLQSQKVQINRSQNALMEQWQVQEMIDEFRNSWLYKLMKSPWFYVLMATVIGALIAVIAIQIRDKKKMNELEDKFGSNASQAVKDALKDMKGTIDKACIMIAAIAVAVAILVYISGPLLILALGAIVTFIIEAVGIMQTMVMEWFEMALAGTKEDLSKQEATIMEWDARSKYFGSMVKHFQEGLNSLWERIEELFKSQSTLIKTLEEGAMAIVRNIPA
jgi:hypothetical protein